MSHRGPEPRNIYATPTPSPMEPKTLKWSPKFVQKCNKRFWLNWLGIFTVLVSKIASNSKIFDTFFETHDFAKISVSPRREHDFRGSEPADFPSILTPPGHSWASRDHLFGVQNPTFFDVGSKIVPKKSLEAVEIAFGTILEGFWRDLGASGDDFERILVRFWDRKSVV